MTAETLAAGEFHLWRYPFPAALGATARLAAAALSPDERNAAGRYVFPDDGDRFILRRAFLRHVLAHYLGVSPQNVSLRFGPRGKPSLSSSSLEFNATGTRLQTLVVVTQGLEVGIDAEPADRLADLETLSRSVLTPKEADWLASADVTERQRRFLRLWCRKEACLKAYGIGLQEELARLPVLSDEVAVGTAGTAYLQDLDLDAGHVVALATTRPCAPLVLLPSERTLASSCFHR
jgi:4'-phosphopantetheinyl transferase